MTTPAFIPDSPGSTPPPAAPSPAANGAAPKFIPDAPPDAGNPAITPTPGTGVVGEQMAEEGVSDYKPGQGLPFGHYGVGMRTGDITPSQAEHGAEAIGTAATLGSAVEIHAALNAGFKALVPALTAGTVAVGEWATAHPMAAKAIYHTLRTILQAGAFGAAAKIAGKVIDAAPDK